MQQTDVQITEDPEMMKVVISWNGSMIVKDLMGERHVFTPYEAARIGTAWYKFVQKKQIGEAILC